MYRKSGVSVKGLTQHHGAALAFFERTLLELGSRPQRPKALETDLSQSLSGRLFGPAWAN
jgi:hypothetical protein